MLLPEIVAVTLGDNPSKLNEVMSFAELNDAAFNLSVIIVEVLSQELLV